MAVVQNPVTGRSKNAFANAVFTTLLGKNVMRSKPLEVSNPRTPKQVAARLKLATLSFIAKTFDTWIDKGYQAAAVGMYPRNMFVKSNLSLVEVLPNSNPTIYPEELKISKGSLYPAPIITTATAIPGLNASVTYDPQTAENNPDVKTILVVYDGATMKVIAAKEATGTHHTGNIGVSSTAIQPGQYAVLFAFDPITGNATDSTTVQLV